MKTRQIIMLLQAFAIIFSLRLAHTQGPWFQSRYTEVPTLVYEASNALLYSGAKSLLIFGCDMSLLRTFPLMKVLHPSKISIACDKADKCSKVRDIATSFGLGAVLCDSELRPASHDSVIFFVENDDVELNDLKHYDIASLAYMVWDTHDQRNHLKVLIKTPRVVQFHEKPVQVEQVFSGIYKHKVWGTGGGGSGSGSDPVVTERLRSKLVDLLQRYQISSMVDAPCGSMAWMPLVLHQLPDLLYTGIDVACPVIGQHQLRFQNQSKWRFFCADVCHQGLPRVDLIFSRDAMQHLPLSFVHSFIRNVKGSGARFLLIGSYLNLTRSGPLNHDVPIGGYYHVNMLDKPFSLSRAVVETLSEEYEYRSSPVKSMLLLDVSKI